jgi:SAM-dependent methyltransferase
MEKNGYKNQYFKEHMEDYADGITAILSTFYETVSKLIDQSSNGDPEVLDIGNGGVINYTFTHFKKLICADLVLSQKAIDKYKEFHNVLFIKADILDMKEYADESFDIIIIQNVIHHLASTTYKKAQENVARAINECLRVLRPKGKLLITESVVNNIFEFFERLFYPFMQLFFKTCKFDSVYMYSEKSLLKKLSKCMDGRAIIVEHSAIDTGPYAWVMGKKIPIYLTPLAPPIWVKIEKG